MTRTRIALFGLILLVAGGGTVALLMPRDAKVPADTTSEVPNQASEAAVSIETTAVPADQPLSEDIAPAAESSTADESAARGGRGRIFGKVTLPEGAPADLAISVQLYLTPSVAATELTFDSTLRGTVSASADGGYEFDKLPLENYIVLATTDGYTHNLSTELTRQQPELEVDLALMPAGAVAGVVLNEEREPVSGARVFIAGWDIGGQKMDAPRGRALSSQQVTDAGGAFRFPHLRRHAEADQGYRFAVKAEGYATLVSDYVAVPRDGLEFILTPGGVVSGMLVRQDTGAPLPDKVVTIESPIAVDNFSSRTDTEGYFFLTDLAIGAHVARLVDSELIITPETATILVTADASAEDVVLQAASGGRITGQVFDMDTGKGIAGVDVRSSPRGIPYATDGNQWTGDDGHFVFAGLRPGEYRITIEKPEGYPDQSSNMRRSVTARLGVETTGIDFALSRGLLVTGRVVDEDGKPLAEVTVRGYGRNASDSAKTLADGKFTLAGFAAHSDINLSARKRDYALLAIEPKEAIETTETGFSGVTLTMGKEATISGTVVTTAGTPKPGVRVHMSNRARVGSNMPGAESEVDGSISIDGLAPGEYTFHFDGRVSSEEWATAQRVRVAKGEHLKDVRIVYPDKKGLPIAGRVVDAKGTGLSGVNVRAESMTTGLSSHATTGSDGAFRIEGVSEGTAQVRAESDRHSPSGEIAVQAGDEDLTIVLKDYATVEGRVVSARTGQPIPAFRIQPADYRPGYSSQWGFQSISDPSGTFKLTQVSEGVNSLDIRAEGYADKTATIPAVTPGQQVSNVLVRLDDAVVLQGRVVDSSGAGVPAVQLAVGENVNARHDYVDESSLRGTSSADGSFTVGGLGPGTATITAVHPRFAIKKVTVNVVAGVQNRVDIVLTAGGTIEGIVTADDKPLGNIDLSMNPLVGRDYRRTETNAQGRYRFTGLSDGRYSVSAYGDNRNQMLVVDVADGVVTEANFHFQSGNSTIEGTIYTAPNQPLTEPSSVHLSIKTAFGGEESLRAQSDRNGNYRIANVPAGTVSMTVRLPNEAGQKAATLTLGENQRVRRDFHFYGGGTARVRITGSTRTQSTVLLITGHVQLTELSQETLQPLQSRSVAQGNPQDGEAVLSGLDPGEYTALCIAFNEEDVEDDDGGNPFARVQWATQIFSVDEDKEVIVNVQLNR